MSKHPDRMTRAPQTLPTADRTLQGAADDAAQAAADRASVTVEDARHTGQLKGVEQLFQSVWNNQRERPPISADVLRALVHSGSYVAVALDAEGRIVGAGVGFLAADVLASGIQTGAGVDSLHSHIAAVTPGMQRHGIGSALKLHQRAWATRRGLRSITWTFDPLVRRNAAFNAHLGAEFVRYYPDFYGEMTDGRNAGHGSDRLLARWDLQAPAEPRRSPDPVGEPSLVLGPDSAVASTPETTDRIWVATPPDIEQIRVTDKELAQSWRIALRNALHPMLPGWRIEGFTPAGRYLLVGAHHPLKPRRHR